MSTFKTAVDALADKTPGSRRMQCTAGEAMKLAGKQTLDVRGVKAWYTAPIAYGPGQSLTDANAVWIVPTSTDLKATKRSIEAVKAAHIELRIQP
jgi:hypothetical protein